jgi:Rrf2 family protein
VNSYRGPHGGYTLARPADSITATEIIDAIEGPVAITECSTDHSQCSLESVCAVGQNWQGINQAIRTALERVKLSQIARPVAVTLPRIDFPGNAPAPTRRATMGKQD